MKKVILSAVFLAAVSLAACGGGGGSTPNPLPSVTNPPPVTYSISLKVSGGAMGHLQDDLRHPESTTMAATPAPIQMMAPDSTDPLAFGGSGASGANLIVVASVSPAPSAAPSVTYNTTSSDIAVQNSNPTPNPGSTDIPGTILKVTQIGAADAGHSVTATLGAPVSGTDSRGVYVYPGMTLRTGTPAISGEYVGYTVTGGVVTGTTDTTQADIWLENYGTNETTIHTPFGAALISNNTAMYSVTASQWSNTYTSIGLSVINASNGDGSHNNIVVFKGRDGTVCEYMVVSSEQGPSVTSNATSGPIQCHGTSVNGF